jgi:sporulation integral membrane protein YlbJ
MTDEKKILKKGDGALQKGYILFWILLMVIIISSPEKTAESVRHSLSLCARVLIPSLFPFMVISSVLFRCGFCSLSARLFGRPTHRLLHIDGSGVGAILLGALCGPPAGISAAVSLYDGGEITREECECLTMLASNPSAAFTVSAVGVSLLSDRAIGIGLYITVLLSTFIVGYFFCRRKLKRHKKLKKAARKPLSAGISDLTEAISGSAITVIKACSFVVFFGVLLCIIGDVLPQGSIIRAYIFCFFELTSGVAEATALMPEIALPLIGFALSWSGLSIHFQIMSICAGRGFRLLPYFGAKLISGILTAVLISLMVLLFPVDIKESAGLVISSNIPSALSVVIFILFCLSLLLAIAKKVKS